MKMNKILKMNKKQIYIGEVNQLQLEFCSLEHDMIKAMNKFHELIDRYYNIYNQIALDFDFDTFEFLNSVAVDIGISRCKDSMIGALENLRRITCHISTPYEYTMNGYRRKQENYLHPMKYEQEKKREQEEYMKQGKTVDNSPDLNRLLDETDDGGIKK